MHQDGSHSTGGDSALTFASEEAAGLLAYLIQIREMRNLKLKMGIVAVVFSVLSMGVANNALAQNGSYRGGNTGGQQQQWGSGNNNDSRYDGRDGQRGDSRYDGRYQQRGGSRYDMRHRGYQQQHRVVHVSRYEMRGHRYNRMDRRRHSRHYGMRYQRGY
jgi:hypothetical protein